MTTIRLAMLLVAAMATLPLQAFYPQWISRSAINHGEVGSIATGDFDEDGVPDVVTRTTAHTVSIIRTQPGGTLSAPVVAQHPGTYLGGGLVVGDMTGDGHLDVVVGESAMPALLVLPGNGDGTFGTAIVVPLPMSPTDLSAGDFNEDGKIDIAIRSYSAALLAIYAGDGAGNFSQLATIALGEDALQLETGDVDDDGFDDVAIGYRLTSTRVYFGNGNGTFSAPASSISPQGVITDMVIADLNGDDQMELVYCNFAEKTASVAMNNGSRTFTPPVSYPARSATSFGDPIDLLVADVDGDGNRDVIISLVNSNAFSTLEGHGDGTLGAPLLTSVSDFPRYLAMAELTGDARPDLLVARRSNVSLFQNRFGDVDVILTTANRTITQGQRTELTAVVRPVLNGTTFVSPGTYPVAEGTVTLKAGGVAIGTGTLDANGAVIIEVASLPLGTHQITAEFPGDDEYVAAVSPAIAQHVIAEATTTKLTSNAPADGIEYGRSWSIAVQVTSPLPQTLSGTIWMDVNGVRAPGSISAPQGNWQPGNRAPGTYRFQATYSGNANQPPSTSAAITQVVKKAATSTQIDSTDRFRRFSAQGSIAISASTFAPFDTAQKVKLYKGSTHLGTANGTSGSVNVSLPVGVHYLHAAFDGDSNYLPSRSALFRYEVVPDQGVYLSAYAVGTTIQVRTRANHSGSYFKLYRRIGTGPWEWFVASGGSRNEVNAQPNVVYAYRVEEYSWTTDQLLGASNTDIAIVTSFTDDPLLPGTRVKAAHVAELVAATNVLLAVSGGSPITLSGVTAGQPMKAQHLLTLRGAINQGRASLGVNSAQWTNIVEPGRAVRVLDLVELREALR